MNINGTFNRNIVDHNYEYVPLSIVMDHINIMDHIDGCSWTITMNMWINYNVSRSMRCNEMWPVTWLDSDRGCQWDELNQLTVSSLPKRSRTRGSQTWLYNCYTFFTILQPLLSLLNPFWIDIGFIFSRMVLEGQKQFAGDGLPKVKDRRSPASSYWSSFHPFWRRDFTGVPIFQTYPCRFLSFPFRSDWGFVASNIKQLNTSKVEGH